MDETDGKGELNWYRTNIYRYYGGYELKFNRKRMWKRKYRLWTKVKDQLEKFIIVKNWRLPSWMSSEIFKSCTKNWLTNELFTLSHCNNGSVMWEHKIYLIQGPSSPSDQISETDIKYSTLNIWTSLRFSLIVLVTWTYNGVCCLQNSSLQIFFFSMGGCSSQFLPRG